MKKLALLCAAALSFAAGTQTAWPEKTVTLVVPFPAGGSTDTVVRARATELQGKLGQTLLVDNRPGATGPIGTGLVRRAALTQKIAAAAIAAINEPTIKKRMQDQGLEVGASTPADFTAFQAKEYARWRDLINSRGIQAD